MVSLVQNYGILKLIFWSVKVKLTESSLNGLIVNSIKKILRESYGFDDPNNYDDEGEYWGPERTGNYDEPYEGNDLDYDSISKPFKDRVKAQMKGYPSAENEKLHKNEPFGNAYYDSNNLSNDIADHAKEAKKEKDKSKTDGLVSSKYKKETEENSDTMFESKKISKIQFKHTQFLSEGHMLSKVPDEFKVEGKKFIMKDTANNEYLVEWTAKQPNVTKKLNKTQVNEEMNRIKALYGYKSKDYFTTTNSQSRMNENKEFSDMINKARQLMK